MRLRKTPSLHPAVSEELAVLDAALRGDALEPEHEQLRELVLAVRDVAPRPRPEFIDDLDAAVDAGFPGGTGARGRHWPRAWGRATAALAGAGRKRGRVQLALAACGALGVVAAGVVALGTLRGEGGSPTLTQPPSA